MRCSLIFMTLSLSAYNLLAEKIDYRDTFVTTPLLVHYVMRSSYQDVLGAGDIKPTKFISNCGNCVLQKKGARITIKCEPDFGAFVFEQNSKIDEKKEELKKKYSDRFTQVTGVSARYVGNEKLFDLSGYMKTSLDTSNQDVREYVAEVQTAAQEKAKEIEKEIRKELGLPKNK